VQVHRHIQPYLLGRFPERLTEAFAVEVVPVTVPLGGKLRRA
jgi:hypothetical protein